MIKNLKKIIFSLFFILFVFTAQIFVYYFLPKPFNYINFLFFVFFLWVIIKPKNYEIIFITALPTLLLFEFFSSGIYLLLTFSFLLSLLFSHWVVFNLFSSQSTVIITVGALMSIVFFKIVYFFLNIIFSFLQQTTSDINLNFIINSIQEIIITTIFIMLFYYIASKLTKSFNPEYIHKKYI